MPHKPLLFDQATSRHDLAITIRYELTPTPTGTRLVRTRTIVTNWPLRLLHAIVLSMTRSTTTAGCLTR